jgi:NADH:ubiquinone oxidoreductase subunit C
MFGIFFDNNESNCRILTDYGFAGYPLLKEFPLVGYLELRYDDIYRIIVAEPLELSEEFRVLKLDNTWDRL